MELDIGAARRRRAASGQSAAGLQKVLMSWMMKIESNELGLALEPLNALQDQTPQPALITHFAELLRSGLQL